MGPLLRAELWALGNAFRTREGRRALIGFLLVIGGLALGFAVVARRTLLSDAVLSALRQDTGPGMAWVCGAALLLPLLLALPVIAGHAGAELFQSRHLRVFLTSPRPAGALVVLAFVRLLVNAGVFALAAGMPVIVGLWVTTPLRGGACLGYAAATVVVTAPLIAVLILLQVLRARFLSGPRARFLMQALLVVGLLTSTALFLGGLLTGAERMAAVAAELQRGRTLPFPFDVAGAFVAAAGGYTLQVGADWRIPALFAAVAVLLAAVMPLYPQAVERESLARIAPRPRRRFGRGWPAAPVASIVRKDVCELVQERGAWVAYAFLTCVQLLLLKSDVYGGRVRADAHTVELQHAGALLVTYQIMTILVGSLHCISLAANERAQVALLATAPVRASEVLRAKLLIVVMPFAWCLLVVLVGAMPLTGAPPAALAWFLAVALPLLLILAGILLPILSHPSLAPGEAGVPFSSFKGLLPVFLVVVLLIGVMVATIKVGHWARAWHYGWGPFHGMCGKSIAAVVLGGSWVAGLAALAIGYRVGVRNMKRLLGPKG